MSEVSHKEIRHQETQKVTLVGAFINVLLSIMQLLGGFLTHSQGLIADGIHTIADLISDFIVLFASKQASKEADEDHPYGHGRYETLATVILGLMLAGVAVGMAGNAISNLMSDTPIPSPTPLALIFAIAVILGKEGMYHYTMHVAKRINSTMLKANAWHHRSDAVSSVFVLTGIAGAQLGFSWMDSIAVIAVALMIFYMGLRLILDSTNELVDTGLDPKEVSQITDVINQLPGVKSLHLLRTRRMGGRIMADAHVQVDSYISVSEGHHIGEIVIQRLKSKFSELEDITIHIDPEDDETHSPCIHLPCRQQVMADIHPLIEDLEISQHITKTILHYTDGAIEIDIILDKETSEAERQELKKRCEALESIRVVKFYLAL